MRVLIISLLVAVASAASLAPIYKARDPIENSYLVKIKTQSFYVIGCDAITNGGSKPDVASLSLGGGPNVATDAAIERLMAAGYTVSIAAGNANEDACNGSPGIVEAALTVGATESNDQRASYSNYGTCLDIFAPGSDVRSSYHRSDSSYAVLSGTSMACPHVTGVAAVHLGAGTCSNNDACKNKILADATEGVVGNPGFGSPNLLLYCD
uniref:Cuticle-degrading serine protease-like n=1 Tax=Saccoglossus kowalevskii TaxID=10224 RepID=A0ABM0MZ81_SACKO|nr:PREDICTED: cuticle-degrading serine protease-like [Saccoglossus kowalevskii]